MQGDLFFTNFNWSFCLFLNFERNLLRYFFTKSASLYDFSSTSKHSECLQKKKLMLEQIETKLDIGLDRTINAIVGWVKIYLQSEQKKTDFKPESDVDTLSSQVISPVA
jgi:hypothetical protein